MTFVYILISESNPSKTYVGKTTDLKKRLAEHNRGEDSYVSQFSPWKIETSSAFSNEALATVFEKYLKSGSGFAFMKKRLLSKT